MPIPRHAAPGPTEIERLRRFALVALVACLVGMAITGAWLAFRYAPGSDAMPTVHRILGFGAVAAALVAAVATAFDDERSTAGMLPMVVVLGLVAGLYLTGPVLAWETLGLDGPPRLPKGITAVFEDDVVAVRRSANQEVKVDDYRRLAWLHTVALPFGLVVIGGSGLWAVRRCRRDEAPVSALSEP